jgi:serine/threonine protein kinase
LKLGNHELLKEQGATSAGPMWLARAEGDAAEGGKLFSVVRVHKHLLKKPEMADAFLAEVQPAVGFTHANVAALVDARNEDGELFAITELAEGETLATLATSAGASGLPQPVVLRIALDVLEALAAAHEHEPAIVHGELGPHQVMVGSDGVARITGLGTARALSRLATPIGPKNHDRLSYAAPERVKAMAAVGGSAGLPAPEAKADLFSAGVMLWEALAKQRLFSSKIEAAIVQKVTTGAIPALGSLAGVTVPEGLEKAVHKALERDPAKRTSSAALLIAAIETLEPGSVASAAEVAAEVERLAGKAIAARRAEVAKPAPRPLGAPAKPGEPGKPASMLGGALPRKATLLGIPAAKPASEALKPAPRPADASPPSTPAPASVAPASMRAAMPSKPEIKPPSTPQPATASVHPQPRVDEGLEDDDGAWSESAAPASEGPPASSGPKGPPGPPPKRTMMMGSPTSALKQAIAASEKAEAPREEAPKAEPAKAEPAKAEPAKVEPAKADAPKAEPAKAEPAKVEAPRPEPAKIAAEPSPPSVKATETSGGKTAPTPGTDGRSPSGRGRIGIGTEKVGPGSTLGRYEILMPVARGGMASVWAARLPGSRGFQKIFAIKTMLPDVSDDPDFENMFLDEGRVAARIRHPNVVEIIDLGEQTEVLYLVMEWVDGENLGSLVKAARQIGGVPLPVVLKIASQIAAGLHAAHELRDDDGNLVDLVHRDVSPANVLVSSTGYVKIVDFGIAKSKGRLHQTRVGGVVKGKTPYLSPEQLGQMPIDRRSDIFSFGVLLYVLTTGLHPFRGESDTKTIENIALREPVPLRNIVPSMPPEFEAVVLKALQKDPADRFSTAAEMARALDQAAVAAGTATTEEDVAAFVKLALGETLGKRAQELRAAIDRAEGRVPGEPVESPSQSAGRPQGVVTLHEITLGDVAVPAAAAPPEVPAEAAAAPPSPRAEPIPPPRPAAPSEPEVGLSPHPALPPPPLEAEPFAPAAEPPRAPSISDSATAAPLEEPAAPRKRKPVALIAVGAVLGVCLLIGGVALLGGGKSDPPARLGTSTTAAAPKPTDPPAATPAPPPTPSAAPTPADTGAATPPVDTGATNPPAAPPGKPGKAPLPGTRAKPPPPPPPTKRPNTKTYNPPGI